MLKRLYIAFASAVLLTYASASVFGWELGNARATKLPPDVRQSPGGYRSFHFWHSGFHGGK